MKTLMLMLAGDVTRQGLMQVSSQSFTLLFFLVVIMSGAAAGILDTFLYIRLDELGGSKVRCRRW
jgi:hypothetical protein